MSQEKLDLLGKRLMSDFVGVLSRHSFSILDGREYEGAEWYDRQYGALRTLNSAQREAVARLIDDLVVSSCHALLDVFEKDKYTDSTSGGKLVIKIVDESGVEVDAAAISDGLPGEMYGEHGWIERFGYK